MLVNESYSNGDYVFQLEPNFIDVGRDKAGKLIPLIVEKKWGWEEICLDFNLFCMKLLHINKGYGTSNHFHRSKSEAFRILSGELIIRTINRYDSLSRTPVSILLKPGDSYFLPPGFVHKLICGPDCDYVEFIECSTFSEDSDSIRLID